MPKSLSRALSPATSLARLWITLAIVTLILAGILALSLVAGRTPVLSELFTDPAFFRRALVAHVVLALWGWFVAYAAGLRLLVDPLKSPWRARFSFGLSAIGVLAIVASAGIRGAEPLLVNYIPVVNHPIFFAGLASFFAGVALIICRPPTWQPPQSKGVPLSAAIFWRATSYIGIIALVVFTITWVKSPTDVEPLVYFERLFWGVGHTMQVFSVLIMLGAWAYLLRDAAGRSPIRPRAALLLAGLLILPQLAAPFLALAGPTTRTYIVGFTQLMRFGIAAPVLITIALCLRGCWGKSISRAGRLTFLASASLTLVGFILGAMIRGSDTMIPAHYHASLGAITVALMGLTYALAEQRGWLLPGKKWSRLSLIQPALFGVGQIIFAFGFGLGGLFGVDRKAYGSEQVIDSFGALAGLLTMGIGGILAVVGGGAFIALIAVLWVSQPKRRRSSL